MKKKEFIEVLIFLLIIFFAFQIATIIVSHTIFPLEIVAGSMLKNELISQDYLREGWKVNEVSRFTAEYLEEGWWEIYVKISKIGEPYIWTNDYCYFNWKTKEIKCRFWYG